MRTLLFLLAVVCITGFSFAQTDCKPYLPTEQGTTWEITNYSAKGKATGRITYELLEKVTNGNEITFTVKHTTFDKKNKELYTSTFDAKCVDGKFEFDMAYKIDGGQMSSYNNMDVAVDATEFEIPSMDEAPGTQLADGSLKVALGGAVGLNMTINITDRKVEARESITTPAGNFDCVVLSQNISTKMLIGVKGSSKEWYSENIGMIRSESYNKKGKLLGYSELTKLDAQ